MTELNRRSALLALCGTVASGVAAGAWLTRDPGSGDRTGQRAATGSVFAGAVTVLGARRGPLASVGAHAHHGAPDEHHGWSETVVAEVEVHNPTRRPLVVSPGQFRLRVGEQGPTVTYYDSERRLAVLPAGGRMRFWVRYLSPPGPAALALEYTGAGAATPLSLALAPTEVPA